MTATAIACNRGLARCGAVAKLAKKITIDTVDTGFRLWKLYSVSISQQYSVIKDDIFDTTPTHAILTPPRSSNVDVSLN